MKSTRSQTLVQAVIVFGIVVLLNIISIRLFGRIDLTAENVYTLSEASQSLVGSLDDRVSVKAYFTEDLPAPYNGNRRATLDLLNEYKAYAGGNLQFDFINPTGEAGERRSSLRSRKRPHSRAATRAPCCRGTPCSSWSAASDRAGIRALPPAACRRGSSGAGRPG